MPKRQLQIEAAATPMIGQVEAALSPPDLAGFKANDVLVEVEGRKVRHLNDLFEALECETERNHSRSWPS